MFGVAFVVLVIRKSKGTVEVFSVHLTEEGVERAVADAKRENPRATVRVEVGLLSD